MLRIAFIGFGEVSYCISQGLRNDFSDSFSILATDIMVGSGKPYEKLLLERAKEVDVSLYSVPNKAIITADIVFSAVQGAHALEAGANAADIVGKDSIFIDLTTANPYDKLKLEEIFSKRGILFVDAAMLGPLSVYKHKVPMLISGYGAERAKQLMMDMHMNVAVVEGPSGTASKVKLVRSVFMKGLQSLLVETFLFARKTGVEQIILDSISKTMNEVPFEATVKRLITADPIHAERRAHEIGDSVSLMNEIGVRPIVASAVEARLSQSAALGTREELGGKAPADIDTVFSLWEEKQYS